MAHQIDTTSRATASYASTRKEWHGLGQLMPAGADLDAWAQAAGMDYKVLRAFPRYAVERLNPEASHIPASALRQVDDKVVLFRSDTHAPLGVVSDSYKVVQPREVLEFFREWADAGGLTIESAGVLFGGKRYFATARLGEAVAVDGGQDRILPYALLSSHVPAEKMGIYMGIFNMFIVVPQIVAATVLGPALRGLFDNQAIFALVISGASLLIAAVSLAGVHEATDTPSSLPPQVH